MRPIRADWPDQGSGDDIAEELAYAVIGAAIEVHRELGPGLLEGAYECALAHEMSLRGIEHVRQAPVPIHYKGALVGKGRIDLLVGARLVVELKVCDQLSPLHHAQVRRHRPPPRPSHQL